MERRAVATVVLLRRGRVALVDGKAAGVFGLPGGRIEPGEDARSAAARELREELGIELAAERLVDLAMQIDVPDGVTLRPFAFVDPPPASAGGELHARWIAVGGLRSRALLPGVARSLHAALARFAIPDPAAARELRAWWRVAQGERPWRATRDPYALLVCEVMSQQTQIERVVARWERWIARWPTARALADARFADVLLEWEGLGFPRRARDLHASAQILAEHGWPPAERLTELPGVGPYTAAALRCFAFGDPILPLDANVRRLLARRFPGGGLAGGWTSGQAAMELGQRHCRARPRCAGCPLHKGCLVALDRSEWDPAARAARQAPYAGSLRERRGRLLRVVLRGAPRAADADATAAASLIADGLIMARGDFLVAAGA